MFKNLINIKFFSNVWLFSDEIIAHKHVPIVWFTIFFDKFTKLKPNVHEAVYFCRLWSNNDSSSSTQNQFPWASTEIVFNISKNRILLRNLNMRFWYRQIGVEFTSQVKLNVIRKKQLIIYVFFSRWWRHS